MVDKKDPLGIPCKEKWSFENIAIKYHRFMLQYVAHSGSKT